MAVIMSAFLRPNLFERYPKVGLPSTEPIAINEPTHDIWCIVIGPVVIGDWSDSKIGKLAEGQPQTVPNPNVLRFAVTEIIF